MDSPTESNVRRRPDLWSYISFSRPSSRSQNTLPTQNDVNGDRFRKPDRGGHARSHSFNMSVADGYPVGRQAQGQRMRYLKYGGILGVILLLVWFLSPSKYIPHHRPGATSTTSTATSTKCTKPYDRSKPLIQYALMIDAGSTGSRIHVYRFNNCGPVPALEKEVLFKQTEKKEGGSGLSSYDSDAEGAAQSLDPLLTAAVDVVPAEYKSCSPIAVKATAGLRKLGQEKSQRILEAVRRRIDSSFPFPLVADSKGGVEVMDGKDEGVYAWVTINYLLGKIGSAEKTPTAAVFDLGGGSTQIVFEPTFPRVGQDSDQETLAEGEHKYNLTFGGRDFTLYQHSYLGYGLMAARENLHKLVAENAASSSKSTSFSSLAQDPLNNPCIAPGLSRLVDVSPDSSSPSSSAVSLNMSGPSTPSTAQCRALAEETLKKSAPCPLPPCSFAGVHQPPLARVFSANDIILLSYFFDRTDPLGMPGSFTISELKDLTAKVCAGEEDGSWDDFSSVGGDVLDELRGRPEWCLDLSFMVALLHTGYELPNEREVKVAKQVGGNELGWCLGASLPLLEKESGWQCKISQVS